jgi:pimeloyl-ACP methyl ester carboxylesterase
MQHFLTHSPRQMLKSWYIAFFQIPELADWLLSLGNYAGALSMLKTSGLPATFSASDLEEYRQAYIHSKGLTGMINWYRALARFRPTVPGSIRLRMPVLILWGKQDIALGAVMAEESLKLCDQGKLVFFEHASHWLQHDEAPSVNRHLLEFLRE